MSIFHPDNVFDYFAENLPGAPGDGEAYLSAVARYAKQSGVPVTADVVEERVEGGIRTKKELFLVLTPTERRMRRYPSYHFGRSLGAALSVGWYLVGKVSAGGLGGWAIAGGATQGDIDRLEALIHVVHDAAVIPAMHEVAGAASV
jgi:hypothetical protein